MVAWKVEWEGEYNDFLLLLLLGKEYSHDLYDLQS